MIGKIALIMCLGLNPVQKAEEGVAKETPTEEVVKNEEGVVEKENQEFDWNAWLSQWFSPEQVAMIMSWVAYAGTIIGLVAKLRQLAKLKNTTAEDVKKVVLEEIKHSVSEEVAEQVKPYLDGVIKVSANTNDVMKVFAKILALSQVNDAQSRIAIIELIASLGVIDKELLVEAKETIKANEETKEENKNEALDQIDNIIEETKEEEKVESDDGTSI